MVHLYDVLEKVQELVTMIMTYKVEVYILEVHLIGFGTQWMMSLCGVRQQWLILLSTRTFVVINLYPMLGCEPTNLGCCASEYAGISRIQVVAKGEVCPKILRRFFSCWM